MSRTKRFILLPLLVIAIALIPTFVVFAKELTLLTINGPGIKGEMALKNPEIMMNLEKAGFFDQTSAVQPPKNLNTEAGYTITAYLNLDGEVAPYVQMVYYAADQGQPGYVHYTGRLEGAALQPVDKWQVLTRNADNTFRGLMTANDITIQSALLTVPAAAPAVDAVAAPTSSPLPIQTPHVITALVAGSLALIGVALFLRRRTVSNPT
jgi:hypothetical protein